MTQKKMPVPGKEFIRGNRDGTRRRNESYTVCRLQVPVQQFAEEVRLGKHHHSVTCTGRCPALDEKYLEHAGKAATLARWQAADLGDEPRQTLTVVHPDPQGNGETVTICRLGVPRATLVEEIKTDPRLHQHYGTVRVNQQDYVRGIPTEDLDNVNHPEPFCRAVF